MQRKPLAKKEKNAVLVKISEFPATVDQKIGVYL